MAPVQIVTAKLSILLSVQIKGRKMLNKILHIALFNYGKTQISTLLNKQKGVFVFLFINFQLANKFFILKKNRFCLALNWGYRTGRPALAPLPTGF